MSTVLSYCAAWNTPVSEFDPGFDQNHLYIITTVGINGASAATLKQYDMYDPVSGRAVFSDDDEQAGFLPPAPTDENEVVAIQFQGSPEEAAQRMVNTCGNTYHECNDRGICRPQQCVLQRASGQVITFLTFNPPTPPPDLAVEKQAAYETKLRQETVEYLAKPFPPAPIMLPLR